MITYERLRELLTYDNSTGKFYWINDRGGRAKSGFEIKPSGKFASVQLDGKTYKCHMLAFLYETGKYPDVHISHANGDSSDNRFSNLEENKYWGMKCELSQEILKEVITYNRETGDMRWRVSTSARSIKGSAVGSVNENRVSVHVLGNRTRLHRLAWLYEYGYLPDTDIDHVDTNPQNNAISNLRLATKKQNRENVRLPNKNNQAGYRGVFFSKKDNLFIAKITHNYKSISVGYFKSAKEASDAYIKAKRRLHEFNTM